MFARNWVSRKTGDEIKDEWVYEELLMRDDEGEKQRDEMFKTDDVGSKEAVRTPLRHVRDSRCMMGGPAVEGLEG